MQNAPKHLAAWTQESDSDWEAHISASLRHYSAPATMPSPDRFRSLGLVFFNPSLRTRTSMEVAAARLGAYTSTIIPGSGVWGMEWRDRQVMDKDAAEHIQEAIGVLSRYYDALGVRLFASGTDYVQDRDDVRMNRVLQAATVPVINLESAFYHPCQALADAATLHTHFGGNVKGRKFVLSWAWHPKALPMAVPNSALLMATRLGMEVTVARPEGFELDPELMRTARSFAERYGLQVEESDNLSTATDGADVVYAKSWGSRLRYQDPDNELELRNQHRNWRISAERLGRAAFMHCLPVRRGIVVDDEVLDGPQAIHLLQAEFRLYAQMAILERVWNLE